MVKTKGHHGKTITGLIIVLIVGIILFWQFSLQRKSISCGGDWSYNVRCPLGTYCRSLGQSPQAGGLCTPYLSFFKNPVNNIPVQFPVSTPSSVKTNSSQSKKMYINNKHEISFQYPSNWELEIKEYDEQQILVVRSKNNNVFELNISPFDSTKNGKKSNEEIIEAYKEQTAEYVLYSTSGLADWGPKEVKKENIYLDNVLGKSYTFLLTKPYKDSTSSYNEQIWIYVIHNDKSVRMTISENSGTAERLLNQIISTFKFQGEMATKDPDNLFLRQINITSGYDEGVVFKFGPQKKVKATIQTTDYGQDFGYTQLYELASVQPTEPGKENLFAASRIVNLENYLGQRKTIYYREVIGLIMTEEQFVFVDKIE